MTAPLDEKGLAAAKLAWTGDSRLGLYPEQEAALIAAIRAYFSAVALPDELEVVAWRYRLKGMMAWHTLPGPEFTLAEPDAYEREAVVTISQAHSTIAALRAERDEAQQELKAHDLSFDLRYKSDMRACKRWQEATGRTMTLPDHTDLSMWLFAQLETAERNRDAGVRNLLTMQGAANKLRQRAETAEAEVKRLTEDNEALRAEVARCHARLEIDHVYVADGDELVRREVPMDERLSMPDAVECRDATISILEADARKAMEGGE